MTEPPPRSGGTVFLQVLVAALFLAVIGGSVGLVLGLQGGDGGSGASQGTGKTQGSGETQGSGTNPARTPGPGGDSSSALCPPEVAEQAGRGELAQELYIKTKFSEVWICRDAGGALYYQGHRFTRDDRLFLTDVRQEGAEFLATSQDGATVYRVSRLELRIENTAGGAPERQPVVTVSG